ncbi:MULTISPECIES: NTP transferase domain-containing protein [Achromobacter]|uniref:MobA-like NTP transferase domain-containing protein n=3 Tax=Achromobacter TaxID=222 RepID=A0ABM8M3H3_9BURK|nr:NTP transferase domain-containing protein [Achromobacter ruhlandii]AMG46400.1 hypothetical protein AL520_20215 [Achromobacter xylosoxidans]AOU93223.1 putative molybdopterin cytidylyl transferase [Achromobacter ruhlandii]MCZ8396769.1 NTP transferase domain-containing protein [Achromobacter ruhlandii]MCZ8435176.1 NTP transferase domain-containing protein [Achromobacter ruhlandii]MDC6090899.1 NTP transferase domain-containing protein [Achromobacter ruhlandii]
MNAPIAAIILAAGQGARLGGRAKSALCIDGISLLERLTQALRDAGVAPVRAVIGPYADTLAPLARRAAIDTLPHARPDATLADSQRLALREHARAHPGHDLLLVLADLPLLDSAAIAALLAQWRACAPGTDSLRPRVDGAPGHPLLLSAAAVRSANLLPPGAGLRQWLDPAQGRHATFDSDNRAYVTDLDTPDDLRALRLALAPAAIDWPPATA